MNTSRVFTFFGTPGICISMWHWVGSLVVLRSLHSESSEQWSPCCFFLFQVHHTWSHHVGTILRIHILPRKAKSVCWKLDFYFYCFVIMTTLKGEWVFSFSFWLNLEIGEVYIFFIPFLASCLLKCLGYIFWKC